VITVTYMNKVAF